MPLSAPSRVLLLCLLLSWASGTWSAGPSVGELLRVCDRAFAQGFTGIDAATCEWYAAPCACKLRDPDDGALAWCVPDSESIDITVEKVVAALRRVPGKGAPAQSAVRDVLVGLYPCTGERIAAPDLQGSAGAP